MIFISPLAKCLVVDFHLTFNLRSHISLSVQHLCCHCWDHGNSYWTLCWRGSRGRMVVGFTTTYAISVYHQQKCEFESHSWRGVLDTILCEKVCQWLVGCWWFSLCTRISSTNKSDRHDRDEILLTVALNTVLYPPWLKFFLILQIYLQYSFNWLIYCV